tara:strand:- start:127 stop:864 length:738 start_codon:yes stop_codon:yes gene_type:complete
MRNKKYCIANWKMYLNDKQISNFLYTFNDYSFNNDSVSIVLCPPYTSIKTLNSFKFKIGSQNVSNYKKGAYTGEISLNMLENLNCSYAILGHSELRANQNETDILINQKLQLVNNSSLTPIICIGETASDRNNNKEFEVVELQIQTIFNNIDLSLSKDIIIAYEPIWAIGTGVSADSNIIKNMHAYIKNIIEKIYPKHCNIYLLYGGSVNEDNASSISRLDNVDGFLIGSSSIEPEQFYNIYKQL